MVDRSSYVVLGSRFAVQFTDPQARPELDRLMSPFVTGPGAAVRSRNTLSVVSHPKGGHDLYRDCRRVGAGLTVDAAIAGVVGIVNRAAIEASPWFAVHAGVVASEAGSIAFIGGSGSGKSTLVAACLKQGFRYVSDEALCLDGSGRVVAYPKPLALSADSRTLLGLQDGRIGGEQMFSAFDLGSSPVKDPPALTDIVLSEFGSDSLGLLPVAQSEGWTALLRLSFNHFRSPQSAFELAASVARACRVWRLGYGAPLEGAQSVADRLWRADHPPQ